MRLYQKGVFVTALLLLLKSNVLFLSNCGRRFYPSWR